MAIGRDFGKRNKIATSARNNLDFDDKTESVIWTMPSGNKVSFEKKHFSYSELSDNKIVLTEENLREQKLLSPYLVKNVSATLAIQQFIPCIVRDKGDGTYDWLDGSRRLYAARNVLKCGLDAWVSPNINKKDAEELTQALHSSVNLNIREIGKPILQSHEEGASYSELMEMYGFSKGKITRCISAARVPTELLLPFLDINVLTHNHYIYLNGVTKDLTDYISLKKKGNVEQYIKLISDLAITKSKSLESELKSDINDDIDIIKHTEELMDYILEITNFQISSEKDNNKPVQTKRKTTKTTVLKKFKDKKVKAVMKVAGNKQSFVFTNLDESTSVALRDVIDDYLSKIDSDDENL